MDNPKEHEKHEIKYLGFASEVGEIDETKWHYPFGMIKDYMETELEIAGFGKDTEYDSEKGRIRKCIMELIDVFVRYEPDTHIMHYCRAFFRNLLVGKPLTPLTGEDDEWEPFQENIWRNKRYSNVFKDNEGEAVDARARLFRQDRGAWRVTEDSIKAIKFPYSPQQELIQLDEDGKVLSIHIF